MSVQRITGLVAATHTPFTPTGDLNLTIVERQAEMLVRDDVAAAFVGGTTGESASLTVDERIALAGRWGEVVRGSGLKLIVHAGANCLADARAIAGHAQEVGAAAVAALSPSYFKPRSVEVLAECMAEVAGAAPGLPFYFYDIPSMTGVALPMPEFLGVAGRRIANLAGLKFTNPDLAAYQRCLGADGGRFDVLWGTDEYLLAAMALGATGAVGSSYNFAGPVYRRVMAAFAAGDWATARAEQLRAVEVITLLAGMGYMAAAKAVMGMRGVDVGPPRLPHVGLTGEQIRRLREGLEAMGFVEWVR